MQALEDLEWRGLVAQSTDRDALAKDLDTKNVRFYVGFDPTAPSLHMGNLVQLVTARRLQLAGHTPFLLVGGATGMIGDPRDSGERTLNPAETVAEWTERLRLQVSRFVSFEGENAAQIVSNYDWTKDLSVLDFLRDIGKHFPVNRMLARDTVKRRLEAGISYTEFSYVLLQSMDYLHLFRNHGVTLQHGATDQWGNITAGAELIRRVTGGSAHAFVTPLITKADGTKYGKTEGGALWLDREMLSPYDFYQFWLNVEDVKVGELLRIFTFLSHEEIEELERQTKDEAWRRAGHRALAREITTLVHGADETEKVEAAAAALFGGADMHALDGETLGAALAAAGTTSLSLAEPVTIVEAMLVSGLAKSNGDARRTIGEGGAYLNNERISDPERLIDGEDVVAGRWLVLRRGKKQMAGIDVSGRS